MQSAGYVRRCAGKAFSDPGSIPGASTTIQLVFPYFRDFCPTVSPTVSPAEEAPTATERPPSPRDRTSIEMPSSFALGERCMYPIVAAKER